MKTFLSEKQTAFKSIIMLMLVMFTGLMADAQKAQQQSKSRLSISALMERKDMEMRAKAKRPRISMIPSSLSRQSSCMKTTISRHR